MLYEEWRGEYLGDKKIGYSYTILESLTADSEIGSASRYRLTACIGIPSQEIVSRAVAETGPDLKIRLLRIESTAQDTRTEAEGTLVGEELIVRVLSSGAISQKTVPAGEGIYLADAVPLLLARQPPEPGDRVTFSVLDPTMLIQGPMTVEALGSEDWRQGDQPVPTLHLKADYLGISMDLWIGPNGETYESRTNVLNLRSLRESRESLEEFGDFADLNQEDLIFAASIPSNIRLRDPEEIQSLTLELRQVPEGIEIPSDSWQQVLQRKPDAIRLRTGRPDIPPGTAAGREDLQPFLQPSLLIQSDDARIRDRAHDIVGTASHASERASRIAKWISREMRSELRVSTPSAAEILESMRGDCNEHATLFAALCRAVDIPTKICAGIVYQDGRFYYHAWNEFFDPQSGWIPVDTAFGQFPADPTHIKLAEGDLEEHALIAQVVGKIQLEILEVEPNE